MSQGGYKGSEAETPLELFQCIFQFDQKMFGVKVRDVIDNVCQPGRRG